MPGSAPLLAVTTRFPPDAGPEALVPPLLAGAERVYVLLDANRIANLPTLLEASGLEHGCLFQGELVEEAGRAAPWLVALHPGDRLLTQLLDRARKPGAGKPGAGKPGPHPYAHLTAEPGIYFHSAMPLAALRQHLRRFLRVQAQDGRAFFFRFWEPKVAEVYFPGLADRPALLHRWFYSREGHAIEAISVARLGEDGAPQLLRLTPEGLDPALVPQPGAFTLSEGDVARLQALRLREDAADLARRLADTFPETTTPLGAAGLAQFAETAMARMMQAGFRKKAHLMTLLSWELHFGPGFETRDPEGKLAAVMATPGPENERFAQVMARMEAFT